MRSNRSISLPLSFVVTCCVWLAFLWTMQHAPTSHRPASGEDFTGGRSTGGLANNFASAVVKFFDNQDPREVSEDTPPAEPYFDNDMVEYLPLPKAAREEFAKDLPEVFADLSLTPRNLFRSDVDLDGDNDLDLALLVRLSKTEALGAVLEYLGDEEFRFAGKFYCRYERAEDFSKCFTVVLTGVGTMHILSRTSDLKWKGPAVETDAGLGPTSEIHEEAPQQGWRWMRLEKGALASSGEFMDPVCKAPHLGASDAKVNSYVEPVPGTNEDLLRIVTECGDTRTCTVYRFDAQKGQAKALPGPQAEFCLE